MCYRTLVKYRLEEEENGAASSSPSFPGGVPPRRKAMFSARKAAHSLGSNHLPTSYVVYRPLSGIF